MGTLSPDELLRCWAAEQLAPEQAIGQLVQHLARMQHTLDAQRQTLAQVQGELARLQAGAPAEARSRTAAKARP